jgi:hypothetical protein
MYATLIYKSTQIQRVRCTLLCIEEDVILQRNTPKDRLLITQSVYLIREPLYSVIARTSSFLKGI